MTRYLSILFVGFALLLPPATAAEQFSLQTVRLSHQPAENIIGLMQGILPPSAAIEGRGDQIVLRARKADLPALVELVAKLDTPLHQFEILVSLDPAVLRENLPKPPPPPTETQEDDGQRIQIRKPGEAEPHTRRFRTRGRKLAPGTYTVRVLENEWATIRTGKSIPIATRTVNPDGTVTESIRYQPLNRGLRVRPQVIGGRIRLQVQPYDETESRSGGGKLQHHAAETTVMLKPGQWIAIGAVSGHPREVRDAKVYRNPRVHSDDYDLFLRVDVVPGD